MSKPFLAIEKSAAAPTVRLALADADVTPINPRIFGNFLEHLGYAIQGGVRAELLMNPTLFASPRFPNQNVPAENLVMLRENGVIAERLHRLTPEAREQFAGWRPHLRATGFGLLVLDDQTNYGIPLPWTLEPHGAGAGQQAARIGSGVVLAPAGDEAILAQGVFAPHERVLDCVGSLWVKGAGDGSLRVALRRRAPGAARAILVEQTLPFPGERWQKIEFALTLPADTLAPLEPVDFCIIASGTGRLWVDRASLMPADHVEGLDPTVLDQIRSLAPPILRWPGGNFTSTYHWHEGIGPQDERQTYPNLDWGGIEDNLFGVAEFLRLCELVETEPHLCVNMGNGTPEEAAAWVEYVNGSVDTHWGALRAAHGHAEPWGVRLWEIGNEIYGVWQTGSCGSEENARRYRVWAEAMLAADPTIELLATGNHGDFIEPWEHWNQILVEEGGEHVTGIALHALPGNAKGIAQHSSLVDLWQDLMAHPHLWETQDLPNLLDIAQRAAPDRAIDIAITEWGILGDTQRPQVGNLGGALYGAFFLNMSIRQSDHLRVCNATALMHGGALRKAGPFRYEDPQVEVIRRYTTLKDGARIPITYAGPCYDVVEGTHEVPSAQDVPWVDAVALRMPDGSVTIVLANRSAHSAFDVSLESDTPLTPVAYEVMTGHMREMNTPIAPDSVRFEQQALPQGGATLTVNLPARAIGWLRCIAA